VTPSIVIVEDDAKIRALIAKNLGSAGYLCHEVAHGDAALPEIRKVRPALVVLDVMLPGADGLEITRRIRKESDVPILMVTSRSGEGDKVLGLEVGADDYLVKPFSTLELVARVRALLRRSSGGSRDEVVTRGGLRIDPGRRIVEKGGTTVEITSLEFDLLYFLARHPGRVFSRQALMDQVWGEDRVVDDRSIDSIVSRLRKKLERDPGNPEYVQTVWGAGYRFNDATPP
jgi:DNA-binding response OmpR family regulator